MRQYPFVSVMYRLTSHPSVNLLSFVYGTVTLRLLILLKLNGLIDLSGRARRRDVLAQQCHLSKLLSCWDRETEKLRETKYSHGTFNT